MYWCVLLFLSPVNVENLGLFLVRRKEGSLPLHSGYTETQREKVAADARPKCHLKLSQEITQTHIQYGRSV